MISLTALKIPSYDDIIIHSLGLVVKMADSIIAVPTYMISGLSSGLIPLACETIENGQKSLGSDWDLICITQVKYLSLSSNKRYLSSMPVYISKPSSTLTITLYAPCFDTKNLPNITSYFDFGTLSSTTLTPYYDNIAQNTQYTTISYILYKLDK